MLKYILLGFLQYEPMTGYDLKIQLEQSTSHFWHAYHSQIYTTLHKLEEDGFVVSSEIETDSDAALNKKLYHITVAGSDDFAKWMDKPIMDAQKHKHALLVRLFFSAQRDREAILYELRTQRHNHQRRLDAYKHIPTEEWETPTGSQAQTATDMLFWQVTLDYGVRYEEMYIAWLDDTITKLESLS